MCTGKNVLEQNKNVLCDANEKDKKVPPILVLKGDMGIPFFKDKKMAKEHSPNVKSNVRNIIMLILFHLNSFKRPS